MILLLIVLFIVLIIISSIYPIYQSYKDYTILDRNSIKSPGDLLKFLKFLLQQVKDWIECHVLGLFSHKYKKTCFTGAVVLSQEDEQRLDAATPGSLGDALVMLKQDQVRQREDFERADEALDALEGAIINSDSAAIFQLSDEVEMDEEALYWRAWITAQTGQMTHNLVNMEICGRDDDTRNAGKVVDYMDLAATGKNIDSSIVTNKTSRDFRWSNRCANTGFASAFYGHNCTHNQDSSDESWVKETITEENNSNAKGCTGTECSDPSGIFPVKDDNQAFHLGNFSGYSCSSYAQHYCKEGHFPDHHLEVFGSEYNWPELNCCSCGGGSRGGVDGGTPTRHKYEFIKKNCNNLPHVDYRRDTQLRDHVEKLTNENIITSGDAGGQGSIFEECAGPGATGSAHTLNNCMIECDENPSCKGLFFRVKKTNDIHDETTDTSSKVNLDIMSITNSQDEVLNCTSSIVIPNTNKFKDTCDYTGNNKLSIHKIINNDGNSETIGNLLHRNDHEHYGCEPWTATNDQGYSTAFLKKMPLGFQTVGFSGQNDSETNSEEYENYDVNYNLPTGKTCSTLPVPTDYKPKTNQSTSTNSKRTDCFEIDNCANAGITCPSGQIRLDNVLCGDDGCNNDNFNDKCCSCAKKDTKRVFNNRNEPIGNYFNPYYISDKSKCSYTQCGHSDHGDTNCGICNYEPPEQPRHYSCLSDSCYNMSAFMESNLGVADFLGVNPLPDNFPPTKCCSNLGMTSWTTIPFTWPKDDEIIRWVPSTCRSDSDCDLINPIRLASIRSDNCN